MLDYLSGPYRLKKKKNESSRFEHSDLDLCRRRKSPLSCGADRISTNLPLRIDKRSRKNGRVTLKVDRT